MGTHTICGVVHYSIQCLCDVLQQKDEKSVLCGCSSIVGEEDVCRCSICANDF